jgi:hypothetical protein
MFLFTHYSLMPIDHISILKQNRLRLQRGPTALPVLQQLVPTIYVTVEKSNAKTVGKWIPPRASANAGDHMMATRAPTRTASQTQLIHAITISKIMA